MSIAAETAFLPSVPEVSFEGLSTVKPIKLPISRSSSEILSRENFSLLSILFLKVFLCYNLMMRKISAFFEKDTDLQEEGYGIS